MRFLSARRLAVGWLSTMLVSTFMVFSPASALAVTCSGYGCDGTSPQTTGCSVGAYDLLGGAYSIEGYDASHVWRVIGKIEMRYSPTCHTVWARVTNVNRPGWQATRVERDYPYKEYSGANGGNCASFCRDSVAANVGSYGYQLYYPSNTYVAVEGYLCANSTCTEGTGTYSLILGTNPN